MKKILLIGTILILVAITGVWAEGTLDIKNITYPNLPRASLHILHRARALHD